MTFRCQIAAFTMAITERGDGGRIPAFAGMVEVAVGAIVQYFSSTGRTPVTRIPRRAPLQKGDTKLHQGG